MCFNGRHPENTIILHLLIYNLFTHKVNARRFGLNSPARPAHSERQVLGNAASGAASSPVTKFRKWFSKRRRDRVLDLSSRPLSFSRVAPESSRLIDDDESSRPMLPHYEMLPSDRAGPMHIVRPWGPRVESITTAGVLPGGCVQRQDVHVQGDLLIIRLAFPQTLSGNIPLR